MGEVRKRDVEDIVASLRRGKSEGLPRFAVLVGAGASYSAGVPLAKVMVRELKSMMYQEAHPTRRGRVTDKTVQQWIEEQPWYQTIPRDDLAELEYARAFERYRDNREDRRRYIAQCVERSQGRLNAAHMYLARLVLNGHVGTILTTNFDDLAYRALFWEGINPVVCHKPEDAKDAISAPEGTPRVIMLHGHHLYYDIKNLEREVSRLPRPFSQLLRDVGAHQGLIVVGYRGGREYVMGMLQMLAFSGAFPFNLYWVAHGGEASLNPRVRSLLEGSPHAFLVENEDADTFFGRLNHGVGGGFPTYIHDPLAYLHDRLTAIGSLAFAQAQATPGLVNGVDYVRERVTELAWLAKNRPRWQRLRDKAAQAAGAFSESLAAFEGGNLDLAEAAARRAVKVEPENAHYLGALGTILALKGTHQSLDDSTEWFKKATEIRDDFHEAFYHWGNTLAHMGSLTWERDAARARCLFEDAFAKYQRATDIKKDFHQAFNNWGAGLTDLAHFLWQEHPNQARAALQEASVKFQRATFIRGEFHEAFNNWGNALGDLARLVLMQDPDRSRPLFDEAFAKYQRATEIKPDFHQAFSNWGEVMLLAASLERGERSRQLQRLGQAKLEQARRLAEEQ